MRRLVEGFLDKSFDPAPSSTYLVYSPGYSQPDRPLFDDFLDKLRRKLGAEVRQLPAYDGPPHRDGPRSLRSRIEKKTILTLKKIGIH